MCLVPSRAGRLQFIANLLWGALPLPKHLCVWIVAMVASRRGAATPACEINARLATSEFVPTAAARGWLLLRRRLRQLLRLYPGSSGTVERGCSGLATRRAGAAPK